MAAQSRRVGIGDRVVVQLPKSVDAVALYLGVLRLGAVYVPLNTAYTQAEVEWFVADAQPAAVVREADTLDDGLDGVQPCHDTAACGPDDLAALVYTSGTTGRPKGAMLTHGNLATNALALNEAWAFQPDDVLLHALPIFHVHGLMVALHTAMLSACEMIFLERFDAAEVLACLHEATVMMGVPTYYSRLMALDGFDAAACSRIRLLVSGSAPMTAELHRAVAERTGCEVLERYGMSEALMIASNPSDGPRVAGTVGFALPGIEVRVRGDDGCGLPGEAGMVEVKGPNVGPGYWRRPDATAQSRTEDGWFITGDIGRLDDQGRLTLEGRAGDMIITGGLNVYPAEVEQVLDAHPAVTESAVVGLAHPDLGEAVAAFVVAEPRAGSVTPTGWSRTWPAPSATWPGSSTQAHRAGGRAAPQRHGQGPQGRAAGASRRPVLEITDSIRGRRYCPGMHGPNRRAGLLTALGCAVLVVLAAAACSGGDDTAHVPESDHLGDGSLGTVEVEPGDAVQIRSLNTITGDVAYLGIPNQRGVELAVADFGPIHGFDVDLGTRYDDLCSSDGAQAAAQTIVADEDVIGVIGPSCSTAAVAASPLITAAHMVLIAPSNTSPTLTSDLAGNPGINHSVGYYRTSNNGLYVGETMARFAF